MLTLLLFSRKSYTTYYVMCFFPLCAVAAREGLTRFRAGLFGIFGLVAMIESTLWFRWLNGQQFIASSAVAPVAHWKVTSFLLIDVLLIAFYLYYWRESWRAFQATVRAGLANSQVLVNSFAGARRE